MRTWGTRKRDMSGLGGLRCKVRREGWEQEEEEKGSKEGREKRRERRKARGKRVKGRREGEEG